MVGNINYININHKHFPAQLLQIKYPPKQLYVVGGNLNNNLPKVAIIGSRMPSLYGQRVVKDIASKLARAGVVIVSGLAYGIDSLAQKAAVESGGITWGVLAGGLDKVYPAANLNLAKKIVATGGSLISEYPEGMSSMKHHFVARNRLVSGLSDGVLVIEAAAKSGTQITANFALEQNKIVMAVPGEIYKENSGGTNNLIKAGAEVITSADDVLNALSLKMRIVEPKKVKGDNEAQNKIIAALNKGLSESEDVLEETGLDLSEYSMNMTMLEIKGIIRPTGANHWELG
jgi:DNA processing protein